MRSNLEHELAAALAAGPLDPRQARAVALRLGWTGSPPKTLAAAGAVEGYTRERVRQLERRTRVHLASRRPRLPLTEAALDLIESRAPVGTHDVAVELAGAGIARHPFHPAGVLIAAGIVGLRTHAVVRRGVVYTRRDVRAARAAPAATRRLVIEGGATSVSAVAHALDIPTAAARAILEHECAATWLDADREWLVVPAPRSRLATALRKMLAVTDRLGLGEAEEGLARIGVALPADVLRSACSALDWVDVAGDTIQAVQPIEPERVLSPLERTLIGIFRVHGPVIRFTRAVRLAAAAGINPATTGVYLGRAPVIRCVARGSYALVGVR